MGVEPDRPWPALQPNAEALALAATVDALDRAGVAAADDTDAAGECLGMCNACPGDLAAVAVPAPPLSGDACIARLAEASCMRDNGEANAGEDDAAAKEEDEDDADGEERGVRWRPARASTAAAAAVCSIVGLCRTVLCGREERTGEADSQKEYTGLPLRGEDCRAQHASRK